MCTQSYNFVSPYILHLHYYEHKQGVDFLYPLGPLYSLCFIHDACCGEWYSLIVVNSGCLALLPLALVTWAWFDILHIYLDTVFVCMSVFIWVYPCVCVSYYFVLSLNAFVLLSVCMNVCLCVFFNLSLSLSVFLSSCSFICLSVYLFLCSPPENF